MADATPKKPTAPESFFSDDKKDTASVEATRHIPLQMIAGDHMPAKLRRHPGGARVERGTKLTVSKDGAEYLKAIGYAK